MHKSWIEISRSAILSNYRTFHRFALEGARVMPVVKANAYGHGLKQVAEILSDEASISWLAADHLEEAIELRESGWSKNILVLGYIPLNSLSESVKHDIAFVLFHEGMLDAIERLEQGRARIHLPIETGLHREGIPLDQVQGIVQRIQGIPRATLEGVQMHFANIEDTKNREYADKQLEAFQKALDILDEQKNDSFIKHTAASAAAILYSDTHFDLIRLGIALYGLWPSEETREGVTERDPDVKLKPALCWKTMVAQVKEVRAGEPVSYGLTEKVERDSRIAVLPIGYSDGFDRVSQSGRGEVLIGGKRCKIIGRICMNMCMADVTDVPNVRPEDEVVIIGTQGDETMSADEIATKGETINYEIVSRLSRHIPRLIVA